MASRPVIPGSLGIYVNPPAYKNGFAFDNGIADPGNRMLRAQVFLDASGHRFAQALQCFLRSPPFARRPGKRRAESRAHPFLVLFHHRQSPEPTRRIIPSDRTGRSVRQGLALTGINRGSLFRDGHKTTERAFCSSVVRSNRHGESPFDTSSTVTLITPRRSPSQNASNAYMPGCGMGKGGTSMTTSTGTSGSCHSSVTGGDSSRTLSSFRSTYFRPTTSFPRHPVKQR